MAYELSKDQEFDKHNKLLWAFRAHFDSIFTQIAEHVIPEIEDIQLDVQPGQEKGRHIFDGTARQALEVHANGLYGYVVSPAIPWFRYTIKDPIIGDRHDVKVWMQDAEQAIYAELTNSNFYREIYNFIMFGSSIGTAAMLIEDNFVEDIIHFETVHPGQVAISEGYWGKVDCISRKYKVELRHIVKRFGEDSIKQDEALWDAYKENPYKMEEFYHLTVPRDNFDKRYLGNKNMPFASVWMRNNKIINESGYKRFPWACWRYNVIGSEVYGNSPAMKVLPDIKTLNKMSKALLKYAQLQSNPPMNVFHKMKGRERFIPGGYNYFRDKDQRASAINMGGQFSVGIDREERRQRAINQAFSVDFFLMLANAENSMTATEVIERQGERAAVLGPMVGRFTWEGLETILDRVFDIAIERGRIPTPPDVLLETGQRIEIDFIGPLAQAQKRLLRGSTLTRGLELMLPIMDRRPDAADNIDWDETIREIADSSGMPQKALKPFSRVLAERQARAQAQAQMANAEVTKSSASALKDVAQASEIAGGLTNQAAAAIEEGRGVA